MAVPPAPKNWTESANRPLISPGSACSKARSISARTVRVISVGGARVMRPSCLMRPEIGPMASSDARGQLADPGDEPVDLVGAGVRRDPGAHGAGVAQPGVPGGLDGIEAAGRCVDLPGGQSLVDEAPLEAIDAEQHGGGAPRRTPVEGDAVDRAEPGEQALEQRRLVGL